MKVAIYDFDGTITTTDTLPVFFNCWSEFGYPKIKLAFIKLILYFFYILHKLKLKTDFNGVEFKVWAMSFFIKIFKGMYKVDVDEFLYKCSNVVDKYFFAPIVQSIERDKKEGYTLILVSGAYEKFVVSMGERLGFDYAFGTKIEYLGQTIDYSEPLKVVMGSNKLSTVLSYVDESKIDWENSKAYADSYTDLHILEKTGNPIAVNPDEKLLIHAKSSGWKIIN